MRGWKFILKEVPGVPTTLLLIRCWVLSCFPKWASKVDVLWLWHDFNAETRSSTTQDKLLTHWAAIFSSVGSGKCGGISPSSLHFCSLFPTPFPTSRLLLGNFIRRVEGCRRMHFLPEDAFHTVESWPDGICILLSHGSVLFHFMILSGFTDFKRRLSTAFSFFIARDCSHLTISRSMRYFQCGDFSSIIRLGST